MKWEHELNPRRRRKSSCTEGPGLEHRESSAVCAWNWSVAIGGESELPRPLLVGGLRVLPH